MKKFVVVFLALGLVLGAAVPAEARVFVGVGFGCCGYPAYYPGYYGYPYYYYPGYYAAPPPVAYAPMPVAVAPVPAPVVAVPATPTLGANPASETFIDASGRTCRQFQTTSGVGPAGGTACLMPDGTWHAVTE